jgi:hypothetical protein
MAKAIGERRTHPRVETRLDLHGAAEPGGSIARMVASNLSLGGLHCTSEVDYPEMTRLAVRLMLPCVGPAAGETEPVDVEAVVVRRVIEAPSAGGDPRFGLSLFFTRLDETVRRRLQAFITR